MPVPTRFSSLACQAMAMIFALSATTMIAATPARADMMSACSADISSFCSDVSRGRGRIAACLVGQMDALGAGCRTEVETVARSGQNNVLVPRDVRRMMSPDFRGNVPASCAGDIGRFCPGVAAGDSRQFACLYARLDKVDPTCASQTESAMSAN